jgi:hypothetical protein
LERTLLGAEEEEKLLMTGHGDDEGKEEEVEGLIEMALEASTITQTSKKESGKRVRSEGAVYRVSTTNTRKRMRSDKEGSITSTSRNDVETDPENESDDLDPGEHPAIDPTLFRQLRSRRGNQRD